VFSPYKNPPRLIKCWSWRAGLRFRSDVASQTTSPSHVEQLYLYMQLHSRAPEQSLAHHLPTVFGSPETWAPQLVLWHFWSLISCRVDAGVTRMPVGSRIIFWPCCVHVKVNQEDKCACFRGSCKFCQQLWLPCPALEINHTPHFISRGFPELSGCLFLTFYLSMTMLSRLPRHGKVPYSQNVPSVMSKYAWRATCNLLLLLIIDV